MKVTYYPTATVYCECGNGMDVRAMQDEKSKLYRVVICPNPSCKHHNIQFLNPIAPVSVTVKKAKEV